MFDHEKAYQELKKFYHDDIRRLGSKYGYRQLSEQVGKGHDGNYMTTVLRRDAFGALRRLYLEIIDWEAKRE